MTQSPDTPIGLEELAGRLHAPALKLLCAMSDGELVYPLATMAEDAGLALTDARKAMAALKALDLTQTGPLFNEDGYLRGRGTWLNRSGLALRSHIQGNG